MDRMAEEHPDVVAGSTNKYQSWEVCDPEKWVPDRLTGVDLHLAVVLDGERTGIHFRNHIACPTEGVDAEAVLTGPRDVWNQILTGSSNVRNSVDSGDLSIEGDTARVFQALAAIDHPGFE
jgi:hypothetical protein